MTSICKNCRQMGFLPSEHPEFCNICSGNDPEGEISRLRELPETKELVKKVERSGEGYNKVLYSIKGLPPKIIKENTEWGVVEIESSKDYLERVHKLCTAIITSIRDCAFGYSHRVIHHNGETYVETTVYID